MKIIKTEKNKNIPENVILFDIETTGLSAQSSYVYLIGMMMNENDKCVLTQLFADNYSEEKEIVNTFRSFLKPGTLLVSYNGTTFDVPYLNRKFKRHAILYEIVPENTLDLYTTTKRVKKYLELENLKQVNVEKAAGFMRSDRFTGEELTEVYAEYAGISRLAEVTKRPDVIEKADALMHSMLLHNHDDLVGLSCIFERSGIEDVSKGILSPHIDTNDYELSFLFDRPLFAAPFEANTGMFWINNGEHSSELVVSLVKKELKYFFSDYKNYTFVIDKGYAMHSSVVSGMAKENLKKCKKEDAYIKKTGDFVPVPREMADYCGENGIKLFKETYSSKELYAEISDMKGSLADYALFLLKQL
jgi:uncharacterized protein YprB with RNaseH-like and TPR domain